MSEALVEIFMPILEPIIEARVEARALEEGLKKGIQGLVEILRDLGHEDIEIRQIIQKKYDLSDEAVSEYV